MYDITSVGELLIDFTPEGKNEQGMELFSCNPGGAPANVLVMATILGDKPAFIGKVGADFFGTFLKQVMDRNGIDTGGLAVADRVPTTLAFVHLDSSGDRSFSFYRNPGADIMLTREDVKCSLIDACRIFHFGAVSLTDEPARSATAFAADYAHRKGKIVSFDPNYRPLLWKNEKEAREEIIRALPLVDILKVSEEELNLLTGESDLNRGAAVLASFGPQVVLISLGKEGAFYRTRNISNTLPTYDVKTIDSTGAGDAFLGAFLHKISGKKREDLQNLTARELDGIIDYANAAGSLTTTKKGAIPAMPDDQAIRFCRENVKHLV